MMRPTLRAVLLFAISLPAALLIVALFREYWYVSLYLPFAALVFIVIDMTMTLPNRRLYSDLEAPSRLNVGQSGVVRLSLLAEDYARPAVVEALLEQSGDAAPPMIASGRMSDGRLELDLLIVPARRGQVLIKRLWLRWRGPFGLIEMRRQEPVEKTIDVTPDIKGIHQAALQFFSRNAIYGTKTQQLKGEGSEFDTLREYAPGMDSRFIDWKRSASHRKLLCKEFRQERNHQIILGFDAGHLMLEPINGMPKLDHAIKAGLLLSWVSLHNGDLIGGVGFDARLRSFLKPGRGMPYFTRFQRFAAELAYRTEETNFTLGLAELNVRLQRRALIVLFTEFVDTISAELLIESLQIIARTHVVIFVTLRDPMLTQLRDGSPDDFSSAAKAVIADGFLRERAVVLERIARLGVHCLDVPAEGVSAALLNRYLMIKQRGLL